MVQANRRTMKTRFLHWSLDYFQLASAFNLARQFGGMLKRA